MWSGGDLSPLHQCFRVGKVADDLWGLPLGPRSLTQPPVDDPVPIQLPDLDDAQD